MLWKWQRDSSGQVVETSEVIDNLPSDLRRAFLLASLGNIVTNIPFFDTVRSHVVNASFPPLSLTQSHYCHSGLTQHCILCFLIRTPLSLLAAVDADCYAASSPYACHRLSFIYLCACVSLSFTRHANRMFRVDPLSLTSCGASAACRSRLG